MPAIDSSRFIFPYADLLEGLPALRCRLDLFAARLWSNRASRVKACLGTLLDKFAARFDREGKLNRRIDCRFCAMVRFHERAKICSTLEDAIRAHAQALLADKVLRPADRRSSVIQEAAFWQLYGEVRLLEFLGSEVLDGRDQAVQEWNAKVARLGAALYEVSRPGG